MSAVPPSTKTDSELSAASKGVAKASWIMVGSLFLSRVLGIIRDAIIAGMFGRSAMTDAYGLAFQVPDLLFFLISGGALSSAFIPVFSEYWHTDRKKDAWKVFSAVMTIMCLVITIFIGFSFVFAEALAARLSPGKVGTDSFQWIVTMSRILLPAQFAFFIGGIMMGTLYARRVFSIPGLGPNIYNIGIILGAVVISHFVSPGVYGMCIGATIGAFIGNIVIPFFVIRKMGLEFSPTLSFQHEGTKKVFRLMLPVVLGLSLPGVFAMIMRGFGSYFPAGVNTALDYGNKLMQAPLGVLGQSIAIAVFPVLTQFYAQKKMDLFRNQLEETLKSVLYMSVPVSIILGVMSQQVVAAIFQHGLFTLDDTKQTAEIFRYFSFGIWAWCLHPILMRAFYSIQDTITPIVIGTVTTFVFIGMVYGLKSQFGYLAMPIAGSVAPIIMVIAMGSMIKTKIGGFDIKSMGMTLGKSAFGGIGAFIVSGLVAWTPVASKVENSKLFTIFTVFFGGLCAMWAYYGITKKLNMPETARLDRAMEKINRKIRRS
jgi:putative peptidoglycan lipid II flippase